MKQFTLIRLLILSLFLIATPYAMAKESLDKTVVIVNDDMITQSELNHAITVVRNQLFQERAAIPEASVLRKQVLEQMITRKLQLQFAKQAGVSITDTELDNAIRGIAERNHLTVKELYARLSVGGLSAADYREEMHDQMLIQRIQQQEVVNRISVSPEEVDRFMQSESWRLNSSKEYHIEDILIPVAENPTPEDINAARQRAAAILQKLQAGADFSKMAQAESSDKNALQGGDLGWRKLPEIPSAFAERITSMQAKQLAGPIQTPNGFHLIRLSGVRTVSNEAQPTNKQIENLILERKFAEAVQNWISRLRGQAYISTNNS